MYAPESATGIIEGNPQYNSKENDYSTVEVDGAVGHQKNKATPDQQAKQTNSTGYDLAKPQMKREEGSKDYDHFEHLGHNQRSDKGHDSNDTYAHAHVEGNDNNDTYSHAQIGQYFHSNEKCDDTYEHAKNVGCGNSDTYDHSNLSGNEDKEELSDYANAHAHSTDIKKGDYDHAGFVDRNGNDTYE